MKKQRITLLVVILMITFITVTAYLTQTTINTPSQPIYPKEIYQPTSSSENQKIVCIVFDDGWASQLEAIPILDDFGFKATLAIVTSYTERSNYLSWAQIASLAKNGHDIESHTCNHLSLNTLDNQSLYHQIADSQQILRSKGYAANILVYPFGEGTNNQTVKNIVSQYYLLARATDKGAFNIETGDKYAINAFGITNTTTIEQFKSNLSNIQGVTVAVLYYHRIGDGSVSTMVTRDQFQTQMQYLKDNNFTILTMDQLFLKQAPTS